jgi:hypothetical protein
MMLAADRVSAEGRRTSERRARRGNLVLDFFPESCGAALHVISLTRRDVWYEAQIW